MSKNTGDVVKAKAKPKAKSGEIALVAGLMPKREIAKRVTAITTAAKLLKVEVHNTAMECLKHIDKHGDSTPARDMVMRLKGHGINNRALILWFNKHGHVEAVLGGDGKPVFKKVRDKAVDLAKAQANPFYEDEDALGQAKADKPIEVTLLQRLTSLVKTLEDDALANDRGIVSICDASLLASLTAKRDAVKGLVEVRKSAAKTAEIPF